MLIAASLQGLVAGQLGNVDNEFADEQGRTVVVSEFIQYYYGLHHSFIGW